MTATIQTNTIGQNRQPGGAPFGNMYSLHGNLSTNSSGVPLNSQVLATGLQATAALTTSDVCNLAVLPAGALLQDILVTVSTAFAGSTTCSIGFAAVSGVSDALSPDDPAHFVTAGQSLASAAIIRKTATTKPVKLNSDAYLTVSLAGAAQTTTAVMDADVSAILTGGNGS